MYRMKRPVLRAQAMSLHLDEIPVLYLNTPRTTQRPNPQLELSKHRRAKTSCALEH